MSGNVASRVQEHACTGSLAIQFNGFGYVMLDKDERRRIYEITNCGNYNPEEHIGDNGLINTRDKPYWSRRTLAFMPPAERNQESVTRMFTENRNITVRDIMEKFVRNNTTTFGGMSPDTEFTLFIYVGGYFFQKLHPDYRFLDIPDTCVCDIVITTDERIVNTSGNRRQILPREMMPGQHVLLGLRNYNICRRAYQGTTRQTYDEEVARTKGGGTVPSCMLHHALTPTVPRGSNYIDKFTRQGYDSQRNADRHLKIDGTRTHHLYDLIGLKFSDAPSEAEMKTGLHERLKRWHPDKLSDVDLKGGLTPDMAADRLRELNRANKVLFRPCTENDEKFDPNDATQTGRKDATWRRTQYDLYGDSVRFARNGGRVDTRFDRDLPCNPFVV